MHSLVVLLIHSDQFSLQTARLGCSVEQTPRAPPGLPSPGVGCALVNGSETALPDRLVREAWKDYTDVPHPDEWPTRRIIFSEHAMLL